MPSATEIYIEQLIMPHVDPVSLFKLRVTKALRKGALKYISAIIDVGSLRIDNTMAKLPTSLVKVIDHVIPHLVAGTINLVEYAIIRKIGTKFKGERLVYTYNVITKKLTAPTDAQVNNVIHNIIVRELGA